MSDIQRMSDIYNEPERRCSNCCHYENAILSEEPCKSCIQGHIKYHHHEFEHRFWGEKINRRYYFDMMKKGDNK